jgi:hypothetical protein
MTSDSLVQQPDFGNNSGPDNFKVIQGVPGGMCQTSGECSLC